MKRVLLTGARGFLGQAIARVLAVRGWDVVRTSTQPCQGYAQVDLLDEAAIRVLLRHAAPNCLVHAAWRPIHGDVMGSPDNLIWLAASINLVRLFREHGGVRAAVIGTSAEYDWTDGICLNNATAMRPASLYGACKHALHVALESYGTTHGLRFVWPRVFDLYGPGDHESRLVAYVVRSLIRGIPAECTEGLQIRDYLYVDDVAAGIVAALESPYDGAVDIASGREVRVRDVALEIARQLGREDLLRLGARPRVTQGAGRIVGDATAAARLLGWMPRTTLEQGIGKTIAAERESAYRFG